MTRSTLTIITSEAEAIQSLLFVMTGLDPAIHVFPRQEDSKTWTPGQAR